MNISDVSKKYGLSQDTLRYYERVGMIPPVNRTPAVFAITVRRTVNG